MNRSFVSFPVSNFTELKKQLLHWANQFDVTCVLDNNKYPGNHSSFECILAAGVAKSVTAAAGNAFNDLQHFSLNEQDWIFGHFGYDLKNELERASSLHTDGIGFPDLFFFMPQILVLVNKDELTIGSFDHSQEAIFHDILHTKPAAGISSISPIRIDAKYSKQDYMSVIAALLQHIHRGDCYEINFCQEFFADNVSLDPLQVFFALNTISPNPFGAYYKVHHQYLCCASPERYLKKSADRLISQPIKGTSARHPDEAADKASRLHLMSSIKERSENVMIVDLVRNDLSRICVEGSVQVDELFGIYSFPHVHQMISTISGQLPQHLHWIEAIKATFPMGSMTGAPKKRVMELIEEYERSKRGLFSGAVGYVTPEGDFDFNVVIRSVLYNKKTGYLSYQAGSAITHKSDAEEEYSECLLKAMAIEAALAGVQAL